MKAMFAALAVAIWMTGWIAGAPAADAQGVRIAPFDEAEIDPEFQTYRARLLEAIVTRDLDAVLAAAHPEVLLDYGGGAGRGELRARLLADPETMGEEYWFAADRLREEFWAELEAVLRLGGVFSAGGTEFTAPYIWVMEPPADLDAFDAMWITGEDVPLLDRPSRWGKELGRLHWDVVAYMGGAEGTPYEGVELANGSQGFVPREYVRSFVGYRAIFQRRQGEWQMTVFIAGD